MFFVSFLFSLSSFLLSFYFVRFVWRNLFFSKMIEDGNKERDLLWIVVIVYPCSLFFFLFLRASRTNIVYILTIFYQQIWGKAKRPCIHNKRLFMICPVPCSIQCKRNGKQKLYKWILTILIFFDCLSLMIFQSVKRFIFCFCFVWLDCLLGLELSTWTGRRKCYSQSSKENIKGR